MNLEQIFSAMSYLAMAGWLCLLLAPVRRPLLVTVARVIAAVLALAYAILIIKGLTAPDAPQGWGFDSLAKVTILLSTAATLLPAWIHFLCFDLWVGTWEVEDAPKSGVPHWLVIPCLGLTFMLGPIGLLLYLVLRTVAGRMKPKAA